MRLVLAICGLSGSGKTTLIEQLLPRLSRRGLHIGVLKHDTHRLDLDRPGKDTARFFDAGAAAVCAHDPGQHFVRIRQAGPVPLSDVLPALPADLDLVLVEGHKGSPLPKLVLRHPERGDAVDGSEVIEVLEPGPQRVDRAEQLVLSWLEQAWRRRPLGVALFVGGDSDAAGRRAADAHRVELLTERLRPLADRLLLVGGVPGRAGERWPHLLADTPGLEGPLGGLLALLRYDPERAWLCVAADQARFGLAELGWLLDQRSPGVWAVLPRLGAAGVEPFGAIYEPMLRLTIEQAIARGQRALHQVIARAPAIHPEPPAALAAGWRSPSLAG